MSWVAFHAPMKPPCHPTPSGDREIARLTLAALERTGRPVRLASTLRMLEKTGDPARQQALTVEAEAEAARILAAHAADPPAAWLTYHCYWKAPDLIGPRVSAGFGCPYLITEPSISPRRRDGPWAGFAAAAEAAIAAADRLFWTTGRDRPALEAAGHAPRMTPLPPFLETGPTPRARGAHTPLRLLTVAMMRAGDKLESYRRLAAALPHLACDWRLDIVGDGDASAEVRALTAPFEKRICWHGALEGPALRRAYASADLLVWPGVNEGVGMVWLEAMAAGLPVIAEDGPAARSLLPGPLAPAADAHALARAIETAARDRQRLGTEARRRAVTRHGIGAAADILDRALTELGA